MQSLTVELVCDATAQLFSDNTLGFFTKFMPEQLNLNGQWEIAISQILYPSRYQKVTEGKLRFFWWKTFKVVQILLSGDRFLPFHFGHCWSHEQSHLWKKQPQRKLDHIQSVSRNAKIEIYLAKDGSGLAYFTADLRHFFGAIMAENLALCWEEKDFTNQNLLTTLSAYILSGFTRTWLSAISFALRKSHCCIFSFCFRTQTWEYYNYWTVLELSDILQPIIHTTALKMFS